MALAPAVALSLAAAPALAAQPEQWPTSPDVSTLYALLLLGGVPLILIAVITFLVYVPSMARGGRYTPGLAWHNENEWFGGPSGGLEVLDRALDRTEQETSGEERPEQVRGGASARW